VGVCAAAFAHGLARNASDASGLCRVTERDGIGFHNSMERHGPVGQPARWRSRLGSMRPVWGRVPGRCRVALRKHEWPLVVARAAIRSDVKNSGWRKSDCSLPFRVFGIGRTVSGASPPGHILSWTRLVVQSNPSAAYRVYRLRDPPAPLAISSALGFSGGGCGSPAS